MDKPATIEYCDSAVASFDGLTDIDAIDVHCEYTGRSELDMKVGRAKAGPFIFIRDSNGQHAFVTDSSELTVFNVAAAFLNYRQTFVNSDPRSPDSFHPSLDAFDLANAIRERFGLEIQTPY